MIAGDDISCEFAKCSLLFNADTAWNSEDEGSFKRTNLEEWVRLNIIQSLLRSKLSGSFAVLRSKLSKKVRHVIPFSHVDELRYYEFDDRASSSSIPARESDFKESVSQERETCIEPWLIPEVEESFRLLCQGPSSRSSAVRYKLDDTGYVSHSSCGKFCPFFQIKSVLLCLFGTCRKRDSGAVNDGPIDLELDVLTKDKDLAGKEPMKCPCSAQDKFSEEILDRYRRLLSQAKHSEIVYSVYEQETEINPEGIHLFPINEEKQGFSRAFSKFVNLEEHALYQKINSETVREIWKRAIPEAKNKHVESKAKMVKKIGILSSKNESPVKEVKPQHMGACHLFLPSKGSHPPSKPPGLNVEVPEFYPRKDDMILGQDVSQLYFPSSSFADFSRNLYPYIANAWEDRKATLNPNPSVSMNPVNSMAQFPTPQKINLAHYGIQSDFQGNLLQQYLQPNFQNQQNHAMLHHQILQQQRPNPQSNFLIPNVQNQQPLLFTGVDHIPASGCQNVISGASLEQQSWMANAFRNHYLQQLNNQALPHADQSIYSSQQTAGLQHRLPEIMGQYSQRQQCEQKPPRVNQPVSDTGTNGNVIKPKIDDKEDPCISPPKNIPVFLRPPESYNFTQNDNSARRRNGGGGGGGAVLANLIVLTKGGGRWKSTRHQFPEHGVKEKSDKEIRAGKGEKSVITGSEHLNDKVKKLDEARNFQGISNETSLINTKVNSINESTLNSENISTIVFESSSVNDTISGTMPNNSSTVTLETTINSNGSENCGIEDSSCHESDGSIEQFLRNSRKGVYDTMTSTPIKKEMDKIEYAEPLKYFDVVSKSEELHMDESITTQQKEIEEDSIRLTEVVTGQKNVQASKSLENSVTRWNEVKGTLSDPSFPPIQSKKSRSSHHNTSSSSWTPTFNFSSHRRLYSDVLVPRAAILSSNSKETQVSDASSSVDSLEKHFGELERMALDQYQSSDESVARVYQELERQAVEQYRPSCESETGIAQERSSTLLKEDPVLCVKESNLPTSCSPSDLELQSSYSKAHLNKDQLTKQPDLNTSKPLRVVTLYEVKSNNHFHQTMSSTSLANEGIPEKEGKRTSVGISSDSNCVRPKAAVKSETEIFMMQEDTAQGISLQASHPLIPSSRLKNKRSKNLVKSSKNKTQLPVLIHDERFINENDTSCSVEITHRAASRHPSRIQLPQISQLTDREGIYNDLCSAQHEAPNEQRTQASTMAGTKSEDMKEDPTQEKGTGVPEAWVLNLIHEETTDQHRKRVEETTLDCVDGVDSQCKSGYNFNDVKKSEGVRGKNALDQDPEAPDACALPAKSKENILSTVVVSCSEEKNTEESKRGTCRKRRRGNRRRNKKGTTHGAVQQVRATNSIEDNSKLTSDSGNEDIVGSSAMKLKAANVDCSGIKNGNVRDGDPQVISQALPIPCFPSVLSHDITYEGIRNADRTSGVLVKICAEFCEDLGSSQNKKGGVVRKRRRNRKTLLDKGLADALSDQSNLALTQEEHTVSAFSKNLLAGNKPLILNQDDKRFLGNTSVGHLDISQELLEISQPDTIENKYNNNVQLNVSNSSSINYHISKSSPEPLGELRTTYDEFLRFEDVQFNLGCSDDAGDVAGLMPECIENSVKSKHLLDYGPHETVRYDQMEDIKPRVTEETRSESKKLCGWFVPRGLGCTAPGIGREVDSHSQLMIPSLCEDANTGVSLKYDIPDIDIEVNTECPMNLPIGKGNICSLMDYEESRVVASDIATHPISSSIPMENHCGLSTVTCDANDGPVSPCRSLHYQIPAQSLTRISSESTPRTPRSSTSTKSTSSSPSVLCKLMRGGKKPRKPKGTSSSEPCGRSTPSCALQ